MKARQNAPCDTAQVATMASAFGWAQRLVRRQLDTLCRLASIAMDMLENAARRPVAFDPARPLASVVAIEKTLAFSGKIHWALDLIDALRAKLANDLQRLRRGDPPDDVFAAEPSEDGREAARRSRMRSERMDGEKAERGEPRDREAYDRLPRGFGDHDFTEILKLPTDEIIALICRKLGLSPDWPRVAEEAWEAAELNRAPSAPCPTEGGGGPSGKAPDG